MATLGGHEGGVWAAAADFGPMRALSGSFDRTLKLLDLRERCRVTTPREQ